MAGSGFRPLTNIPYCCLPQESGPCLSTSVGDRPLRSPSHRGLGGPSPRRPSNGTHARPPPPVGFARPGMPPLGRMAHYPAFPPAVRRTGAGCIRVTHPCATLATPKGRLPFDLHVLGLPLAFILSQDQTLRCNIVLLFVFLCISGSASTRTAATHRCAHGPALGLFLIRHPKGPPAPGRLCWPQNLKELAPPYPPLPRPASLTKAGAKVQPFSISAMTF